MSRRLALALVLVLAAAGPAGADTIVDEKQSVDRQISELNERVTQTREREAALKTEIATVAGQIHELTRQVGDVSRRLAPLEEELRLRRLKLDRLDALFQVQTDRLRFLRRQHAIALQRLNERLVALYESDPTDVLAVALSARSFTDFLDALDYARTIADEDKHIADRVAATEAGVRVARAGTRVARARVEQEARVVALRVAQARELRGRLVTGRAELEGARAQRQTVLAELSESEREALGEIEALEKVSAELAATIRAAQAERAGSPDTTPSASGFVWPVSGPVTSAFGWRWGRMHEGIDVGVASGTPIRAVAAGTVIYAGALGGYGNLVVIDHGGGLATAYAHQSAIAASNGQAVAQGQVIGYVGSTGHSFGPHLHFEVRVNGQAVDPLGYL